MTFPIPLLSLAVLAHIHALTVRDLANLGGFSPQADLAIYLQSYMLCSTSY